MNFSEPVRISNTLASVSPNSIYVASVTQHKVIIRLCASLQISQMCSCIDVIYAFSWSPDSLFILCVLKKRSIVQILSIENPDWVCKVDEGSAGLLSAVWAPDSRHFLTTTEFYLRITVWSLSEVSISYLKYPKACPNNLAFSPSGRYLGLLERRNFRDHLSLFDCHAEWNLVRNIQLDTIDAVGLLWSPDERYLVFWDECLRYRATIYSVDGQHLCTYVAYDPSQDLLGVKSVCWSPTGQLLAIGSYDQKCRILVWTNWACLACIAHPVGKPINPLLGLSPTGKALCLNGDLEELEDGLLPTYRPHRIDIYEEVVQNPDNAVSSAVLLSSGDGSRQKPANSGVSYRLVSGSVTIQSVNPDPKLAYPKIGVGLLAFSSDGRFLATRNDNAPRTVWIWSIDHRLSLFSLLNHTSGSVSALVWDPTSPARLAICTGSDSVFMWTPQGCLAVQIPAHFKFTVSSLSWLPSGDAILLLSDTQFCLCYLDSNDRSDVEHQLVWKPPCRSRTSEDFSMTLSQPKQDPLLPVGVFGLADDAESTQAAPSIGDTPNWLRQRTNKEGRMEGNGCGRRRSISAGSKRLDDEHFSRLAATRAVSSSRQAWLPPSAVSRPASKQISKDG
ncbi:unnamed protein product [Calicophoron daubneyi]|uniref:WD repeat-containing protein WRAP73 n=1 Tax=Calicophoron daubneyi TaxID=300641 RepID=A0AAV2T5Q5_CALDB